MSVQTLDAPLVAAPIATPTTRELKPGIYRGKSGVEFGLYRMNQHGVLLYCAPVAGAVWKRAADQSIGATLVRLVDETRLGGELKPGIYRGGSAADFGLWRLRADRTWLFVVPVAGAFWRKAADQDPGDTLIMLVDETRI